MNWFQKVSLNEMSGKVLTSPMQLWEGTDQYEDLIITMLREHIEKDLLDVYHVVLDNAKKGEEKAVKTLLLLQKEIRMIAKKRAETKTIDDEDDLIV